MIEPLIEGSIIYGSIAQHNLIAACIVRLNFLEQLWWGKVSVLSQPVVLGGIVKPVELRERLPPLDTILLCAVSPGWAPCTLCRYVQHHGVAASGSGSAAPE